MHTRRGNPANEQSFDLNNSPNGNTGINQKARRVKGVTSGIELDFLFVHLPYTAPEMEKGLQPNWLQTLVFTGRATRI